MRIATIGDLHLAHAPRLDRYWSSDAALAALVDHLAAGHDRVVLLGDVFQADQGRWIGPDPRVVAAIRRRFPAFFERVEAAGCVWIEGNHDRGLPGARREAAFTHGGLVAHCEHGDRVDPRGGGFTSSLITWGLGGLRRVGLGRACDRLGEGVLGPIHRRLQAPDLFVSAADALLEGGRDVVIFGHSHAPTCAARPGGVYANAGVCAQRAQRYVSVDLAARRVALRALRGGAAVTLARARLTRTP